MARTPKTTENKQKVVAKKITKKEIAKDEQSTQVKSNKNELATSKNVAKKVTRSKTKSSETKKTNSSSKVNTSSKTTKTKNTDKSITPKAEKIVEKVTIKKSPKKNDKKIEPVKKDESKTSPKNDIVPLIGNDKPNTKSDKNKPTKKTSNIKKTNNTKTNKAVKKATEPTNNKNIDVKNIKTNINENIINEKEVSELENKNKNNNLNKKENNKQANKKNKNNQINSKNISDKKDTKSEVKKEDELKTPEVKPVRELKLVLRTELEEIERKDNERKEKERIENEKSANKNVNKNTNKNVNKKTDNSELKATENKNAINNKNTKNNEIKPQNKSEVKSEENKQNVNNKKNIKADNNSKNIQNKSNVKDSGKNENNKKNEVQKNELNKNIKNNNQNNQSNSSSENKNINNKHKNAIPEKKITKEEIDNYFKSGEYIIKGKEDKKNNKNKAKNPQIIKKENEIKINQNMLLNLSQKREAYFKKIFNQIEEFVIKELYLDENIKIVVAVSGGADSIVLLDILANLSVKNSYTLFVAHVDHGLRKESNQDLEHVKSLCKKYNINFYSEKVNVKEHANKKKMSTEEAARELRYDFLEEVCAKTGSSFLALAHNSNDSAETFFINLLRGSGLSGLSGIPQKRPLNTQVNIIRPIINLTRKEIEEYANKRKLKWVEDKTNKENIYLRNKIRNELIPFIEEKFERDIIASINKASKLINSADVFIYHKIKKYLNEVLIEKKISYVEIDLKKLFLFDDFVKGEILNIILKNIFELNNTTQNIIKGILNLYFSEPGAVFSINSKITAYKDRDSLFIARNQLFRNNSIVIENIGEFKFENKIFKLSKIPKSKVELGVASNIEYFDMDYMPKKLEIRHIQDGDKFTPIGMTGRVKISDFLVNNKIPLLKKKDILLLTDRVNIVWVCGLRISDKYKITDSTKNILKVEIIEKSN